MFAGGAYGNYNPHEAKMVRKGPNPVVYFDMTIGGQEAGRIEMTLRADGAGSLDARLTPRHSPAACDDITIVTVYTCIQTR